MTSEQRHYNMSRIRGKDTKQEILVRKYLFSQGLRYRKNDKRLPGHPDLVFPKYKTVIFINGCFWHGHNCGKFRLPKTNVEFWQNKIENNKRRDQRIIEALESGGWRVIVIWECSLKTVSARSETLPTLYKQLIMPMEESAQHIMEKH